ncbi:Ig-like domain-containing protein, partial [Streptomyces sp. SID3212]|uniref:Ig-like domain-containing protein n=1 Tax=Streptomyces sp. SID3212 TaxID=2690259 RepID=UPI0013C8E0C4|nr:hypothetical protein [Streptomyces sp. SID3212]
MAVALAGLVGCTGGGSLLEGKSGAPGDTIRITPEDGAKSVRVSARIEVRVPDGRIERVTVARVEDAQRTELPGRISADGRTWRPGDGARVAPS